MRSIVILVLLTSVSWIPPDALAGKPNDCIGIAAASANAGPTEINGWLARYHTSYHSCVLQKKPVTEKAISTKKVQAKQITPLAKIKPVRKKNVTQPSSPVSNSKLLRIPKIAGAFDAGLASWTKNCTQRYGSFSKDSEFYIASSSRRMPCSMFVGVQIGQ